MRPSSSSTLRYRSITSIPLSKTRIFVVLNTTERRGGRTLYGRTFDYEKNRKPVSPFHPLLVLFNEFTVLFPGIIKREKNRWKRGNRTKATVLGSIILFRRELGAALLPDTNTHNLYIYLYTFLYKNVVTKEKKRIRDLFCFPIPWSLGTSYFHLEPVRCSFFFASRSFSRRHHVSIRDNIYRKGVKRSLFLLHVCIPPWSLCKGGAKI